MLTLLAIFAPSSAPAQSWIVTDFPPDPITDTRDAKADLVSTAGPTTHLVLACDGRERSLALLIFVNGTLTPLTRELGMYWGNIVLRFDRTPPFTIKSPISPDLVGTGLDAEHTKTVLPRLLRGSELWIELMMSDLRTQIRFTLPADTRAALTPVAAACGVTLPQVRRRAAPH